MSCIVCGGSLSPSRLSGLLVCENCSFVTADLTLSAEELEDLYSEDYFHGAEYGDYLAERPLIERNFRRRLEVLRPLLRHPESCRLLEIGCAYGFFLSLVRDEFAHVEGVDISGAAIDYAERQGLHVRHGDFLDVEFAGPYDAICLWDTLEHLARPDLYVAKASSLLRPGGLISITTGDISSLVARLRGRHWRQIHPPTHLHYFSKKTLSRLLSQHDFRVVYCGYDGNYRSVEMMAQIILTRRWRIPRAYSFLNRLHLLQGAPYINLRDIVYVIAEKVD